MGENKKVDGIKKIDREELIKSRKLVLEAIKESEKSGQPADESLPKPKKLDGILYKKNKFPPVFSGKQAKSAAMAPDFAHDKSIEDENKKEAEAERQEAERQARAKQAEEEKRKLQAARQEAERQRQLQEKSRREEEKKKEEAEAERQEAERQEAERQARAKQAEEEKRKLQAARQEAERQRQLQEKSRREEEKKKEEDKKKKRALKQKKRAARSKKIKAFISGLGADIKFGAFKAGYYFFVFTALACLFYLLWLVVVLKFDFDSRISRQAAEYIPTPAIITDRGIVEYYQYKDYKDYVLRNTQAGYTNFKLMLAKEIIKNSLMSKYQIKPAAGESQEETKSRITQAIVYDEAINTVSLGRIRKIKELIENGGDFIQIANKYGDKQGLLNITSKNESEYPFSEEVKKLNISDISDIIIAPDGYYIFKCYEKSINISGLSYVFIEAKSLEDYLNEEALKLRLWNLAR